MHLHEEMHTKPSAKVVKNMQKRVKGCPKLLTNKKIVQKTDVFCTILAHLFNI